MKVPGVGARPAPGLVLAALTFAAALLRFTHLGFQSFWLDEAHTAFYVQDQTAALFWERLARPGENGPVYYALLAPWHALFGGGEVALRAFSALVSLPAIPLTYAVLKRLVGERIPSVPAPHASGRTVPPVWTSHVPLVGTALCALAPYQTWYAQEAKMYALLTTASLAALLLFLMAADARTWRGRLLWLVYVPVALASIYVHFFSLLVVGAHGLAALWRYRCDRGRLAAALAAVAVVTLPVASLQVAAVERDVSGSATTGVFSAGEQAGILLYAFTLNVAPAPLWLVLFGALSLLLVGIMALGGERGGVTLVLLALGPFAAHAVVTVGLRSSLFADRYFIGLTPLLYGIWAAGLLWAWQRRRAVGLAVAALVGVAWVYGTAYQMVAPVKDDFRTAGSRYRAEVLAGDVVVPVPNYLSFPFGYYAGEGVSLQYVDGPIALKEADRQSALGGRRVWVVAQAPDTLSQLAELREWLGAHGRLALDETYTGSVRLQRFDPAS